MWPEYAIYALTGVFGGFFAGLLGIGGGVLITPVLILALASMEIDQDIVIQLAVGTTMAAMSLAAAGSSFTHAHARTIDLPVAKLLLPAVATGAWLGAQSAIHIPGSLILIILSCLLAVQSYLLIWGDTTRSETSRKSGNYRILPARLVPAGLAIGMVSSIAGIGGGVLVAPLLTGMGMPIRRAIGTSAMNTLLISLFGTIGYLKPLGTTSANLPEASYGLVYLPAFLVVGLFSLAASIAGARATRRFSGKALRRIMGVLLALMIVRLFWFQLTS